MKYIILVTAGLIVLFGGVYLGLRAFKHSGSSVATSTDNGVACTMDAKQCPDGSYVGRTGPKCEFAPCPAVDTSNWKTVTDSASGVSFKYPATLGTTYIGVQDWPPKVSVSNAPLSCADKKIINGHEYCVALTTEGAAGTIYNKYAYSFAKDGKTVILTFTLRFPQCENYDEPKRSECLGERSSFDLDALIDRIANTLTLPGASAGTVAVSGISGKVLLGPTCPVERIPPDPACEPKFYKTTLELATANGVNVVKSFSSDSSGVFKVSVPAGSYMIRNSPGGSALPRCSAGPVTVGSTGYTDVTVFCDTGIR